MLRVGLHTLCIARKLSLVLVRIWSVDTTKALTGPQIAQIWVLAHPAAHPQAAHLRRSRQLRSKPRRFLGARTLNLGSCAAHAHQSV